MTNGQERDFVEDVIRRNRYLVLSTTDGRVPWVAPLEYMVDDDLNFYFFSTDDSRHVRDIERNDTVAVAIFDREQPEYTPGLTASLNGVQMEGTARRVPPDEYDDAIVAAIEAVMPPMPPYSVFQIRPTRFHIPRIVDGVNVRTEVR